MKYQEKIKKIWGSKKKVLKIVFKSSEIVRKKVFKNVQRNKIWENVWKSNKNKAKCTKMQGKL